ncbi:MAG: RNA 2',3'-cyclic phosphodiesterase [Thermoplasmata archaeon]|nr:RNA 2',3'-cyclic phosphodiesterase [Thermoplasmata archaeon]
MRAFVAVKVDATPQIGRTLFELDALRGSGVRPVAPDNLHMTLRFLGEVDDTRTAEIADALRWATEGRAPFEMPLVGLGVFPDERYIKVLWIGIGEGGPRDAIVALADAVGRELERIGFSPSEFTPHLTIARVKSANPAKRIRRMVDGNGTTDFGVQRVSEVLLMRSTLTPKGPLYDIVSRSRLEHAPEWSGFTREG